MIKQGAERTIVGIGAADLLKKQLPEDDWIVEGLLTRKNVGFLIGPAKRGKSWLMLAASLDLQDGRNVWGLPELRVPRKMRTVYFTQEDTEKNVQTRVDANSKVREVTNDVWIVPKNLEMLLDTKAGSDLIERELDAAAEVGPFDLVMFDPMRRIHAGNENDSEHIAKLWRSLDFIHNKYNCATLIAHHIKKPPDDKDGYDPADPYQGRGSGDIFGGGDAFVMVVPGPLAVDGKSWRRVSIHFESKRGEPIASAELKIWFTNGQIEMLRRL